VHLLSFLVPFIPSSHSTYPAFLSFSFSFFLSVWLRLCLRRAFYGGSVGRTTKPRDAHTHSLDTHCIQLTLHTQSISTHAQYTHTHSHTHTHTQSPADRSHTSLHPDSRSSTERTTDLLKHYQLFPPGLITRVALPLRSPTAQEAQREEDKLSIRPSSGEFSSCLRTLCETRLSRPHVGSRGALIWLRLCRAFFFFSFLPPLLSVPRYAVLLLLPKAVTLQERGEALAWMRPPVWM